VVNIFLSRVLIILSFPRKWESSIFYFNTQLTLCRFPIKTFRNDKVLRGLRAFLFLAILTLLISCSSSKETTKYNEGKGELIETGEASWYGPNFDGKPTANGETFDQYVLTAAHRTLPFNSIVKVINRSNGKSVVVRINDRGPYAKNRIIDLSRKAAEEINMIRSGHTKVDIILLNGVTLPRNLKTPHYTVQIGSYKKRSDAIRESSNVKDSSIVKSFIDGEIYFRIYVGFFDSVEKAKALKQSLIRKGIEGFVKQIEN